MRPALTTRTTGTAIARTGANLPTRHTPTPHGVAHDSNGHPPWCARGHHCTAHYTGGEHGSIPEVWDTNLGRIVAVRHQSADATRDHIEIRVNVALDPAAADTAENEARAVIATIYASLLNLAALDYHPNKQKGHLR